MRKNICSTSTRHLVRGLPSQSYQNQFCWKKKDPPVETIKTNRNTYTIDAAASTMFNCKRSICFVFTLFLSQQKYCHASKFRFRTNYLSSRIDVTWPIHEDIAISISLWHPSSNHLKWLQCYLIEIAISLLWWNSVHRRQLSISSYVSFFGLQWIAAS